MTCSAAAWAVVQGGLDVGGASTTDVVLVQADWLEAAQSLEAASVDLVYADPPFNTGRRFEAESGGGFTDTWPDTRSYMEWITERLRATIPAIKPTGSILLHIDWRVSHHARLLLDELLGEDRFVNHLVWSYGLGGSSPRRFARKHDDILFYALDPDSYWFEPPMVPATSVRMRGQMKKATDVIDIPSINNMALERNGWPTQKPLALLDMLVRSCCPPGGLVLDPCCGSGTTLVAAAKAGRRAIGVDLSAEALTITRSRIKELGA